MKRFQRGLWLLVLPLAAAALAAAAWLSWSDSIAPDQPARFIGALIGAALVLLALALLYREVRLGTQAASEASTQREWFRTTLRSIGDAVIVTDPDGCIQLLNRVAEQLTGWDSAEAAGRPLFEVFDVVDEPTRERPHDPVARAIGAGRAVGLTNHAMLRARDGLERSIEDSAAPTYDAEGVLQGVVIVFRDATGRRRAELELRRNAEEIARRADAALIAEGTLNTILDNAQVGICLTGPAPDFPIVAISRKMREWIGGAEDMPANDAYHKLLPDGSTPPDERLPLHRVMHGGETVRDEHWLVERRGREPLNVMVNVAPVRDGEGHIVGAVHSWVDLTERERLDRALRVTRARLGVLVDANVIGLLLSFERGGRVLQANDAFLAMLGFDAADLAAGAIDLAALTPPEYRDADERAFREIAETGSCTPYEKELRCKAGGSVTVMVGYARVAEGDEYVGFALDLTERKQLERQLREHAEKLTIADRRKDEFLAMLGHELRNPLAALRNAVHLLESARADHALTATLLPSMGRQVEQLVRLVDDLLDAARITQSKIRLERAVIELAPILHAAVETVQPLVQSRRHALELAFARTPLHVEGDSLRLTQLFANILHNAAKYTNRGGWIVFDLAQEGDEAVVRVRDNGQGIAPELLPRIFDTFVQADQSLARSAGGLGVGLALARRLAELHRGSISAFSAGTGCGSEFVVRLPLTLPPALPRHADAGAGEGARASGAALRVLVVDDNVDLAASTASLLGYWGHEARVVNDGREVIEAAQAFAPEVILLDIGLPGMDGFEVAQRIRSLPMGDVRLIAITGYGQDQDRERAEQAGFDAHLIKPVQPEVLRILLEQLRASVRGPDEPVRA